MAQFAVHEITGYGLVVDCQNDFLSALRSRLVAPLREPDEPTVSASKLNPLVTVDGKAYRVAVQFMRAVDCHDLGSVRATLRDHEFEIKAAIDLLISGF